jgi:hypothetical protein
MIKEISIRVLALFLLFFGCNFIYNKTLYQYDLKNKSEKILELRESQKHADVLYFAESSNVNFRDNDSLKSSISEITNLFFPKMRLVAVNNVASHGGIYKYWLKELDLKNHRPKAVVVTLNLRSFDATWIHSKLETPLREAQVLLYPYPNLLNRFMLSLQAFDNKTEAERERDMLDEWKSTPLVFPFPFPYKTVTEWDQAMANGGHKKPDGSWDEKKIILACHYIKGYAFNITENNPRINDFDEMAAWARDNGIHLYLNLLAENVEYADSLVGKELVFLMKQNRDYLVKRYTSKNCTVVDNLELVPGKEFTDQDWTTEHYGYKGRMIIAKNLAGEMRKNFINEYYKAY